MSALVASASTGSLLSRTAGGGDGKPAPTEQQDTQWRKRTERQAPTPSSPQPSQSVSPPSSIAATTTAPLAGPTASTPPPHQQQQEQQHLPPVKPPHASPLLPEPSSSAVAPPISHACPAVPPLSVACLALLADSGGAVPLPLAQASDISVSTSPSPVSPLPIATTTAISSSSAARFTSVNPHGRGARRTTPTPPPLFADESALLAVAASTLVDVSVSSDEQTPAARTAAAVTSTRLFPRAGTSSTVAPPLPASQLAHDVVTAPAAACGEGDYSTGVVGRGDNDTGDSSTNDTALTNPRGGSARDGDGGTTDRGGGRCISTDGASAVAARLLQQGAERFGLLALASPRSPRAANAPGGTDGSGESATLRCAETQATAERSARGDLGFGLVCLVRGEFDELRFSSERDRGCAIQLR